MSEKLRQFFKESEERAKRKESLKQEALLIKTPVLLTAKRDRGAIIHPSSKNIGSWQVTWWDSFGFSGDTTRKTKEAAIESAIEDGYRYIDRDRMFEKISMSDDFLEAVIRLEASRNNRRTA